MLAKKTNPKMSDRDSGTTSHPTGKIKRTPTIKKASVRKQAGNSTQKKKATVRKQAGNSTQKKRATVRKQADNSTQKKRATVRKQAGNSTQKKKAQTKHRNRSDGLGSDAIRIVEQAASVLEQEISAGIVAAKKVEERYVNVDALRTAAPEQVMQRFRTDAHEVLDIVLDMINLSINAVGGLSGRAMNIRSTTIPKNSDNNNNNGEAVTELIVAEILKPETFGQVGMLVENDNEIATGKFSFVTAGLLNAKGDRLDAKHISFEPPDLEIAAHDVEKITIKVFIPRGTAPGQYSGVIQARALQLRVLLSVQVQT